MCPWLVTMLKLSSVLHILVLTFITRYPLRMISGNEIRIAIAHNCMASLDHNILHSSISLSSKLSLYRVFVISIILYGAETWFPTRQLLRNIDAFDQWCLHYILRSSWRKHILTEEAHRYTDQPPHTHHPYHLCEVLQPHCTC